MKSANRQTLSEKAAAIILAMHIEEMVEAKVIPYPSALKRAGVLNRHGIGVYSIISARQYVKRALDSHSILAHNIKGGHDNCSQQGVGKVHIRTKSKNVYNISLIAFSVESPKSVHQVNQAVINGER